MNKSSDPNGGYRSVHRRVVSTRFGIPICRHDLRSSGTGEREHSWRIITYVKFFSFYWPRAGTRKTTD
ncbi:hypothetical protein ALC60_07119 [Trachymyrmex zeteki]|uniref:Uncharacterized protein n=1 Tax=Mycetomoellerius zeteki TaxID=64791 RepID=A0A151X0Q3_9HYME|nr:hypothetical protein ALC60_07119 [Trachymyrmex zeteki]